LNTFIAFPFLLIERAYDAYPSTFVKILLSDFCKFSKGRDFNPTRFLL
jgi:hypothetical protein